MEQNVEDGKDKHNFQNTHTIWAACAFTTLHYTTHEHMHTKPFGEQYIDAAAAVLLTIAMAAMQAYRIAGIVYMCTCLGEFIK